MHFNGIELTEVLLKFALTDKEADQISLALSICELTPTTPEETEAAKTLSTFADMLNSILQTNKERL